MKLMLELSKSLLLGVGLGALVFLLSGCATINETALVSRDPETGEILVDWGRKVANRYGAKADGISHERTATVSYKIDPDTGEKSVEVTFSSGQSLQGISTPDTGAQVLDGVKTGGGLILEGYKMREERKQIEAASPPPADAGPLDFLSADERTRLLDFLTSRPGSP